MAKLSKVVFEKIFNYIKLNKNAKDNLLKNKDEISKEDLDLIVDSGNVYMLTKPDLPNMIDKLGVKNANSKMLNDSKNACNNNVAYGRIFSTSTSFEEEIEENGIKKLF